MPEHQDIKRLPENLINRIAAGEVVERPASVIKELVENSIDAGASHISIMTGDGGKSLIRVADNGIGMNGDNLKLCVERHATSKLNEGNLDEISSLGFRGEALASIGSVADLSVRSRPGDQDTGLVINVANGKISEPGPVSMNRGTVVEVRNLFEKIPARLKFLKGERAENSAINDVVKRLAMANPSIHFVIEANGRQTGNWPGQKGVGAQENRLAQIMGTEFIRNSITIVNRRHGITVEGMAGLPTFTRANSLMQFFFVNGRAVRDKVLMGAVRAAYGDFIFRSRFPVAAIFVYMEPGEVDVNVHPAKTELRFRDSGAVRSAVISAIGMALEKAGYRASSHFGKTAIDSLAASRTAQKSQYGSHGVQDGGRKFSAANKDRANSPVTSQYQNPEETGIRGMGEPSARYEEPVQDHGEFALGAARAQIFENYIIAQSRDSMLMIDQHAAHERLVYEKFKKQLARGKVASQLQLIPQIVELNEDECAALEEAGPDLEKLGLGVERFGPRAMAVRYVPALLGNGDVTAMIRDIIDGLAELDGTKALNERLLAIIGTMACHGSVRSGRTLSVIEMNALLREMEATPNSGQCIHGRPTHVELKKEDIERLFGRS